MKDQNSKIKAVIAFAMYFLSGATCVIVGSTLPQLADMYGRTIGTIGLLGSAYAFGRILTVYFTGIMVEKSGPLKILGIGALLTGVFLLGIPMVPNYILGLVLSFIGGIAFGTQDAACPTMLSGVFKKNYESSLSFGQGLFGVGTTVTPFLLGIFLSEKISFAWSYYVLAGLAFVIFVISMLVKDTKTEKTEVEEEHIEPLFTKNKFLAYLGIVVTVAAFSAVSSSIGMYTTSFAISKGISESNAAFMFTIYNLGCVLGGFLFTWILRYMKGESVLLMNCTGAFVAILLSTMVNTSTAYFVGLFVAGLFLGVLFSVIVAIATRINYKRVSVACSMVATASGVADFLTPIVVGALIGSVGVEFSYTFALIMLGVCILSALILKLSTTESETN